MEEVKQTKKIPKKALKVAIEETPKQEVLAEPKIEEVTKPEESGNIQAVKGKTPKGKLPVHSENLAKGREKLKQIWEEKRKTKEDLKQKAIEKKINLELKQKKIINKEYGLPSDSESEEEDEEEYVAPVKHAKAKPAPIVKKQKKVKYVEVESESEEEIVYVKKQRAVKPQAPQPPNIIFY